MIWILQSFLGQFFDAMVGQAVSVLGGGSRPAPWSPPRGDNPRGSSTGAVPSLPLPAREPAGTAAAPAKSAAPLDQDLGGDATKLVSYAIVSLRRCHERILPGGSGEVLVTLSMTSETFATWLVACYLQAEDCPEDDRARVARARRNEIPYDEKKYLRVSYEVLSRWPSEPKDCCEDGKLSALEGIRDALLKVPPKPSHSVAAPPTYVPAPLPAVGLPPSPPPAAATESAVVASAPEAAALVPRRRSSSKPVTEPVEGRGDKKKPEPIQPRPKGGPAGRPRKRQP